MATSVPLKTSVLAVLAESDQPLSLAGIHSRLPGVSKPAILRWLQALVSDGIIKRIGESYALLDPAEYNWTKEIVSLVGLKALASASRSGISATIYGTKGLKLKEGTLQGAAEKLLDSVLADVLPNFESLEVSKNSGEGSAQLAGTKFSVIVHFNGTDFVAREEDDVKSLRRRTVSMLSKYGPMSVNDLAQQLGISPVAAYQVVHPLLLASMADREADGTIRLIVKVKPE